MNQRRTCTMASRSITKKSYPWNDFFFFFHIYKRTTNRISVRTSRMDIVVYGFRPFILVSEVIINSKGTRTGTILGTIVILHGIFHVATNSKAVHSSGFNNVCKHAYKAKMQRQSSWQMLDIFEYFACMSDIFLRWLQVTFFPCVSFFFLYWILLFSGQN